MLAVRRETVLTFLEMIHSAAILDAVRGQNLEFGFWSDAAREIQKIRTTELPTATRQPVMVAVR